MLIIAKVYAPDNRNSFRLVITKYFSLVIPLVILSFSNLVIIFVSLVITKYLLPSIYILQTFKIRIQGITLIKNFNYNKDVFCLSVMFLITYLCC